MRFGLSQLEEMRYWLESFVKISDRFIFLDTDSHRVIEVNTSSADKAIESIKREIGYNE